MAVRKIVRIDEEKCDGCGLCVPSCEEGAIAIIDGKAKLVSDVYCDGLGACLGECPQDAITIVEREAEAFDEEAVHHHLAPRPSETACPTSAGGCPAAHSVGHSRCPTDGMVRNLGLNVLQSKEPAARAPGENKPSDEKPSALGHWPIQLHLVPPGAPFLENADLLLVADCVPFACADFHERFLRGRPVLIGCPKLDDAQAYVNKLAAILTVSNINSLTVVHMEVPCCTGLVRIAQAALKISGREIPLDDLTISIRGQLVGAEA